MFTRKSFTIIELIIVIVLILILAGIGIVNLSKSRKKAISREGLANIKILAAAEMIHRKEQGGYESCNCGPGTCNSSNGCNTILDLMLNTTNWTYTVTASGAADAVVTAVSSTIGCTYTFNSSNFENGTIAASSGCN